MRHFGGADLAGSVCAFWDTAASAVRTRIGRSVRPARSLAGDRCVDLALLPRRDGRDVLAPMICAHVLARSAYS